MGAPPGLGFDFVSRLLFPAPSSSYTPDDFPEELLWVPAGGPEADIAAAATMDGREVDPGGVEERIPCLFMPYQSARFVVYYLHSNAEDLGRCRSFLCSIREQFQVHVFAVEYPGYGLCPGGPCNAELAQQAVFAGFRFLCEVLRFPLDSVLVFGRSIGCGPALALASRYEVSGLILVSPMTSFRELCQDLVGPLAAIIEERFPNRALMAQVRSSVLIVHGLKDKVVACRHGLELFRACTSRKLFVCPPDLSHNANLLTNVSYLVLPMLQFFALPDYCFEDVVVPSWARTGSLSRDPGKPAGGARSPRSPPPAESAGAKADLAPSPVALELGRGLPAGGPGEGTPVRGGGRRKAPSEPPTPPREVSMLQQIGMQPRVSKDCVASRSMLSAVRTVRGDDAVWGVAGELVGPRVEARRLETPESKAETLDLMEDDVPEADEAAAASRAASTSADELPEVPAERPVKLQGLGTSCYSKASALTTEDCVEIVGEIEGHLLRGPESDRPTAASGSADLGAAASRGPG